jgi:PAS domain S-box-containing protein
LTLHDDHQRRSSEPAQSADRAREIVDGLGDGFLNVDADWRLTDCNGVAERFFRRPRQDMLGCELWRLVELSKESPLAGLGRRVLRRGRPEEAELAVKRARRSRLLSIRVFPLGGGLGLVWRDITALRAAERRLAESEARHRELAHGLPAAAWLSDASGKLEFINPAMVEALGRPAKELLGEGWMQAIDPDDRAALLATRAEARAAQTSFSYEGRFRRADGALRIIQLYGRPRFDGSGAFRGHIGIAEDLTEARAAELRQRTLINELNHRVKNALVTVQSFVHQTLRDHEVAKDVEVAVDERILALAAAHDVLTRENWEGADLAIIAADAIKPYRYDGRIVLSGPSLQVSPNVALALAMALHELATNAVKHGALSSPEGSVRLDWFRSGAGVTLEWRESGGPPVTPPDRSGFGSRLLARVLAGELGCPAEISYAPSGLTCSIHAPLGPE